MSQINCLYFRSMCGQFGADLKTPNILVEWNGYPEILRLSRDWEIFSWAIFAPLNSYFMEKKSLAAPGTSLALTQLTFSRSIRASSNSELSLFLAFSALLAFCEAVESASSVSASFWVSFFLQESISVKKKCYEKSLAFTGTSPWQTLFFLRFELKFGIPLWRDSSCEGCFLKTSRDIGRARSQCKGDQTKHWGCYECGGSIATSTPWRPILRPGITDPDLRGPVLGRVWWLTAEGIRADKAAPHPAKKNITSVRK